MTRSRRGCRSRCAPTRGSCGWRRRRTRCSRSSTSRRSPRWPSASACARRRQHVRDADAPAPAPARRDDRRALDDEVPERPLRRRRRRGRDERRRDRREAPLHPEVRRQRAEPVRLLHGAARDRRRWASACASTSRAPRASPSWLESHAQVARVHYPGLAVARGARARREADEGARRDDQLRAAGRTRRSHERFCAALRVFACAESLGGVESLAEHPAIMTHASLRPRRARALGIGDGLIRLSVGLEDLNDLRGDLEAGFGAALRAAR